MKILLPVMSTYGTAEAARKAVEEAKKENGSIKLIRVIRPGEIQAFKRNVRLWRYSDGSILNGSGPLVDDGEAERKMVMRAAGVIASVIDGLNCKDVKMETEVLIGNPAAEIVRAARRENAGLIVMGKRGHSEFLNMLFDSTIRRVVSKSPCPVMVVGPDE
ncbi:hypothetical protein SDC9_53698 [bioreactor metagenome]|uniref:UspA domain-containing protein n=1 Tax=bioreactor metagenome TaxID=1076179 RepID=A0A644WUA2_9ZZZZ